MKDRFNRFAVRLLTALLLGLLALLLHGWADNALLGIFLPKNASPWELSKLAYWPMLAALLLTGHLTGGLRATGGCMLPGIVLTAPALFLGCWAVSSLEPSGSVYLVLWVVLTALGAAVTVARDQGWENGSLWLVLAAALGALYVIFTFMPPVWGPFLDPRDVAAMAVIPC